MHFFVLFAATAIVFLTENVASKARASNTQKAHEAIVGQEEGQASQVLQDIADDISASDGTIQLLNNKFKDLVRRVGILEDTDAGTAFFIKSLKDTLDQVTDTSEIKKLNEARIASLPRNQETSFF